MLVNRLLGKECGVELLGVSLFTPELVPLAGLRGEVGFHGFVAVVDDGLGVVYQQAAGEGLTDFLAQDITHDIETGQTIAGVVGIAGDEVDMAGPEKLPAVLPGALAEAASQGLGGDLDERERCNTGFRSG
jgi:hypothetical protein